jgi:hypothetical protein
VAVSPFAPTVYSLLGRVLTFTHRNNIQKITEKARKVKMIRGKANYAYGWSKDTKAINTGTEGEDSFDL